MNEELNKEKELESDMEQHGRRFKNTNIWTGLFIVGVGTVLLLRQSGVDLPNWIFTWEMILISVSLVVGIKHRFRPGGWLVVLAVGSVFLADHLLPGISIHKVAWPVLIMAVGFWIIVKPKTDGHRFGQCKSNRRREWNQKTEAAGNNNPYAHEEFARVSNDSNEFVDTTSIFGGVKKMILSKNFRGGDITNVMGGTEINLIQADIQGKVVIDTTNFFGGTKLIVPSTWDVQSNVITIFGGVDDKRQITTEPLQPNKIVQLTGVCIFGGIEIKSF